MQHYASSEPNPDKASDTVSIATSSSKRAWTRPTVILPTSMGATYKTDTFLPESHFQHPGPNTTTLVGPGS